MASMGTTEMKPKISTADLFKRVNELLEGEGADERILPSPNPLNPTNASGYVVVHRDRMDEVLARGDLLGPLPPEFPGTVAAAVDKVLKEFDVIT